MKFALHLILAASCPTASLAYLPSLPNSHTTTHHRRHSTTRLNYQPGKDDSSSSSSSSSNIWTVLANTERWISDTLDKSNKAANDRNQKLREEIEQKAKMHFADDKTSTNKSSEGRMQPQDNPYARKEVSYVCETGGELCMVVGGIFRRVREARELGESHGKNADLRIGDAPIGTMRQTNVVVIPNCEEIAQFRTFDTLIQAINQARRRAREFVVKMDKDQTKDDNLGKDWVVSINCAHLHPQYGMQTPEEQLTSMKHEEEEGEVDLNLQEYKKQRDEARRSPYPSVIVEVQSTPPPDFGAAAAATEAKAASEEPKPDDDVTSDDVKKLEALFGMSAATKKADDPFYDALGEAFGNKQIAAQTPLTLAQNWVLENDPAFNQESSTFTKSNTHHVDAAYEYVFNNLAMLNAQEPKRGQKSYIVLPKFLPTSATSFDRFAGQVSNIIRVMPSLKEKVVVSTFHPEHVMASTRCPVPVLVITWKWEAERSLG